MPEQMYSTDEAQAEGVSAVKAIAIAAAEGQRICTITQDNLNTALSQIELGTATEQEIRNAVNAGWEVTTHQYQITFHDWVGEGYILIDPQTGAGAYKIAGGGNGSRTEDILDAMGALTLVVNSLFDGVATILGKLGAETLVREGLDDLIKIAKTIGRIFGFLGAVVEFTDLLSKGCSFLLIFPFLLFMLTAALVFRAIGFVLAGPLGAFISGQIGDFLASKFIDFISNEACTNEVQT